MRSLIRGGTDGGSQRSQSGITVSPAVKAEKSGHEFMIGRSSIVYMQYELEGYPGSMLGEKGLQYGICSYYHIFRERGAYVKLGVCGRY